MQGEGYCECGCGRPTPIAWRTRSGIGHVKGHPLRFINGHNKTRARPATERFWEKVDRDGPIAPHLGTRCWVWTDALNEDGYGTLKVGQRRLKAYRFAYELLVGSIPAGLDIDHLCRNKACVNPHHLEPVTRAENNRRRWLATALT